MTEYEKMIQMVNTTRPRNLDDFGMYDRQVILDTIHKIEEIVSSGTIEASTQHFYEIRLNELYNTLDSINEQAEKTRERSHTTRENAKISFNPSTPLDEVIAIRAHQNHYDGNISHDRLDTVLCNLEGGETS